MGTQKLPPPDQILDPHLSSLLFMGLDHPHCISIDCNDNRQTNGHSNVPRRSIGNFVSNNSTQVATPLFIIIGGSKWALGINAHLLSVQFLSFSIKILTNNRFSTQAQMLAAPPPLHLGFLALV